MTRRATLFHDVCFGTYKRVKPRVEVLRGLESPNTPGYFSEDAPVADNVVIKSGQVISLSWNGTKLVYEWILGGVAGQISFIAYQDSSDEDVVECGKLTGLSCLGKFVIQTGYYKTGDTYNNGVALTYDGVTGDLKATTAESGLPILGYCSKGLRGPKSLVGIDSSASNLNVIVFDTSYVENTADAT
jgi:hypothetical protein